MERRLLTGACTFIPQPAHLFDSGWQKMCKAATVEEIVMGYKDAVVRTTIRSYSLVPLLLSDFSDAELLVRPVPGANHVAWQLGHLILQERRSIGSQHLGVNYPHVPIGFDKQHSDITAGMDPPVGFLSKAKYLDLYARTHAATIATLDSLSDSDLDRPVKGKKYSDVPSLGDLFLRISGNQGLHQGQFMVVRRKLGKPVLF
jgi:hypothetical protein